MFFLTTDVKFNVIMLTFQPVHSVLCTCCFENTFYLQMTYRVKRLLDNSTPSLIIQENKNCIPFNLFVIYITIPDNSMTQLYHGEGVSKTYRVIRSFLLEQLYGYWH